MKFKKVEIFFEMFMFSSRWLLVPLYIGLVAANALLIVKFAKEFLILCSATFAGESGVVLASVLSLVDIVLLSNLLVIIIFGGYENFVSKIDTGDHVDRPQWMGNVGFSDLKMKVIGSIVAISGIELLRAFMDLANISKEHLTWKVIIHLVFVVSCVGFAWMDKLLEGNKNEKISLRSNKQV